MGELPYKIPEKKKKDNKKEIDDIGNGKVNTSEPLYPQPSRVYTQEEVDSILQKRESSGSGSGGDEDEFGLSPKLLKGLQSTVGVFNALKEFASSPLTRLIETRVGERAATIVDNAFGSPSHSGGDKKDLLDMFLNSQMAYGFGQGLGARGPEFVESLGKTFGKERIDKFADNMLDQYGKSKGPDTNSDGIPGTGVKKDSSQRDLLMTLDPNNPEHVSAYADSQGGISMDIARKMLIVHQDDFIKQMQQQGLDVSGFNKGKENEEMLKLKREQEEMLRVKREVDKQLAQLDSDKGDKVVSFKDIKGKGEKGKGDEVVDKVVEIPDKWSTDDLSEAERESIASAERERLLANIKNSTGTVKAETEEIKPVETVVEEVAETKDIIQPPNLYISGLTSDNEYNVEAEVIGENGQVMPNPPTVTVIPEKDEVLDLSKIDKGKVKSKFPKGSQGWLKEQKEKKIAKGDI